MSNSSSTARAMAQQALRMKSMSSPQLRQVSRTSPANNANSKIPNITNVTKDILEMLRYVPSTVYNKIQGGLSMSSGVGTSGRSTTGATVPSPPGSETRKAKLSPEIEDVTVTNKSKANASATPGPPSVDPPKKSDGTVATAKVAELPADPEETFLTDDPMDIDVNWQNIEARTKHLVSVLQKNVGVDKPRHLMHHVDSLFIHIYQHHETRATAVSSGVVKILKKILQVHSEEPFLVNRTRELLGILGCNPPIKGRGIRVLSIDGGGVRGLVAIELLRILEKLTGKQTHELFDYICGVSTGSILAFLVGAHRKTLDEAENLYKEMSREIFAQNSWTGAASLLWSHSYYHTATFERILKTHVGDQPLVTLARDPDLPRVSAISTLVNHERVTPYVFRTYTLPVGVRPRYPGGCRYSMWEAVRASAAAPTYFEEIKLGNNIHQDGGVIVNNPTSVAISEAKAVWQDVDLQCVLSLGTGITLTSRADPHMSDYFSTPDGEKSQGAKSLSWKGKFLKVLDSATDTESVHYTLKELLPHNVYFRFNPYLSDVVGLDESKPAKLEKLQDETREYLARNMDRISTLSKNLMKEKTVAGKVSDWWYY